MKNADGSAQKNDGQTDSTGIGVRDKSLGPFPTQALDRFPFLDTIALVSATKMRLAKKFKKSCPRHLTPARTSIWYRADFKDR